MKIKTVCEDIKLVPSRKTNTDACYDLKVKVDEGSRIIFPNTSEVFGTGLKFAIPEGHVMLIFPRSSTGFKLHCRLANSTGVIDAGYRDEVKVAIHNFGTESIEVNNLDRVAQFMIIPIPELDFEFVEDDEDFRKGDRLGGIGSSGR